MAPKRINNRTSRSKVPFAKKLCVFSNQGMCANHPGMMAAAKGLTVRATILAALEEGVVPRPKADLAEERRLLYVAMTRAREFGYGTWARRRTGPTARAGTPRVQERRSHSHFLNGGPVQSQDGDAYLKSRWG